MKLKNSELIKLEIALIPLEKWLKDKNLRYKKTRELHKVLSE